MPRIVVRKSYRCQPGKRRELLAALQRVDAAAAEAGWPRGRYLFVETKSPGEPDVEVEFTFESYSEMEQLERRLREHLGRASRDPAAAIGSAGQEFLLEPSSTRYLLLLEDAAGAATVRRTVTGQPAATPAVGGLPGGMAAGTRTAGEPASATGTAGPMGGAGPVRPVVPMPGVMPVSPAPARPPAPVQPAIQRRGPGSAGAPAFPAPPAAKRTPEPEPDPVPDLEPDSGDEEFEDFEAQIDVPPDPYAHLTPAEKRLRQLADARAALSRAEDATNVSPEQRARARQATRRGPQTD